jgi:glycerol-3-phosphate dehydrogenase
MSPTYDRDQIWSELDQIFDLLIIGGGITGAGIMNTAARSGLKVLLVEAGDFSSGTSSRSSKLVHGGFRYLKNRQINVTRESVRERERLLREAPHLVTPLYFILPFIGFSGNTRRMFRMGVTIYDLLAPKWAHGHLGRDTIRNLCPVMTNQRLTDGYYYYDAEVDDARMVLRCIFEGVRAGGLALNYARAASLLNHKDGHVCGAGSGPVHAPA